MNKYDLDFENIFEYLDIHSFDLDYLKSFITEEEKKLYSIIESRLEKVIENLGKQIEEISKEISLQTNKLNDPTIDFETKNLIVKRIQELNDKMDRIQEEIQNKNAKMNTSINIANKSFEQISNIEDKYEILKIRGIDIVKERLAPSKTKGMKREEIEKLLAIKSILLKSESLENYIKTRENIWQNVDIKNRNLKKFEYKNITISSNIDNRRKFYYRTKKDDIKKIFEMKRLPEYKYSIVIGHNKDKKWVIEPERIFENKIKEPDFEIYDFGSFMYQYIPMKNGRYLYTNDLNRIFGVIRRDEEGKIATYYGIVHINSDDPKFFIDIVFSNIMLRNAMKNNFGFIGYVENNKESNRRYDHRLVFEEKSLINFEEANDVTAISYAMTHEGECNISRKNLSEVFEYIDQLLRRRASVIAKKPKTKPLKTLKFRLKNK